MAVFYIDGDFVDGSKATLPLTDMAILRGYAVFDFLRTYGGKPFHLEDHILRLQNSASIVGLKCPWSQTYLRDVILETLNKNSLPDANLRLLITGGDALDSITPLNKPRLIVMVTELSTFPQSWYEEGVKIITSDCERYLPGAKSTNYLKAVVTLKEARDGGAVESIYVNEKGELLEGTTSNIFVVFGKEIVTPASDILPGVTRDVIINLAKEKYDIRQESISRQQISQCSEVFISSSNKEIVPVSMIDEISVGQSPGPVTQELMQMFHDYTAKY